MERYPLNWPANKPRTHINDRQRATFSKKVDNGSYLENKKLTTAQAIARVEKELDSYTKVGQSFRIPPETVIISTNLNTGVKGKPLSGLAEPADTGVAVYFKLDGQQYCLPCDKWDRVADNLAAVAAHLSALRGIERWGVGQLNDVYTGFKALPENAGETNDAWWMVLNVSQYATPDQIKAAWKKLTAYYHPDKETGNRTMFDLVQKAYKEATA